MIRPDYSVVATCTVKLFEGARVAEGEAVGAAIRIYVKSLQNLCLEGYKIWWVYKGHANNKTLRNGPSLCDLCLGKFILKYIFLKPMEAVGIFKEEYMMQFIELQENAIG